ncbi:MAG TPA: NADH-quinone oxidoreductase subunit L, partial [Nitrococcus sp.]|nr:NADH-quinone oxidoreductase subunit L [Nitrococcus sp.]
MEVVYLAIPLAPLLGAIIIGLFGHRLGRRRSHRVAIAAVGLSCLLSALVLGRFIWGGLEPYNGTVYTWAVAGGLRMEIGFLIDQLTALMIMVVTFVSLMVHIYTIGYMHDDPGYQRFFSYINLFTFAMLMLVMANNFLQLFFGWEAVGLVSYLLIGFWFTRERAVFAGLKAFLINRVGDFGFLLGIGLLLAYFGSLDYQQIFAAARAQPDQMITVLPGLNWSVITFACILLFVGAMGKSAQIPLHVWLPDSMEGPTPISALIHAATMVTAGTFMVARMSPLFELSDTALSVILVFGAMTAFFMGLVGVVQNDIKRVIAYSTLSQLGYMFVALGASAYAAGIFHLMTHAFFKALLFLAAGAVIVALHHEQDMRKMGNLRRYLPITHLAMLVGTLAIVGVPFFSGYFSKDLIIRVVHDANRPGATFAYWLILLTVFVTALYSFRLYFMVFWGEERFDADAKEHMAHLPRYVLKAMEWPLILLTIPSIAIGYITAEPLVFGNFFGQSLFVSEQHDALHKMDESFHGPWSFAMHAINDPTFYFALAGFLTAWFFYMVRPGLLPSVRDRFSMLYTILVHKYGFDEFYMNGIAASSKSLAQLLWKVGDDRLIDGVMVNGTAKAI